MTRWIRAVGMCLSMVLLAACGGGNQGNADAANSLVLETVTPPLVRAEPMLTAPEPPRAECQGRSDGTACTEAGPGGRCYKGQCMAIDAQCKAAWSDYTGVWVGGGRGGAPGSCSNECGELQCTNTQWNNYCYNYHCPAGYTCTINGQKLTGPATTAVCSCMTVQNSVSPVYIRDGTPCGGADSGKICLNRQCVTRPVAEAGRQGSGR